MIESRCGLLCSECDFRESCNCGGCIETNNIIDTPLKVKSVFCFVIPPDMQRKGIATKLLERVCEDVEADEFDVVESYPKEFLNVARDFMGSAKMYEKLGFTVVDEVNGEIVMQKSLK